ncbi:8-amino-7-oxononanoate synthase [Synechocystis sp. PCC 7509]|uniref:8-amino-7-oxononanoate synthase n=1 Tax=Synechocystis sp. PCC 7509 TaxID=927677 RepID=UPI0002AC6FC1|nr:8-amino-7-oxononanoate synthase [Synechocystis sp. PCC 7509]
MQCDPYDWIEPAINTIRRASWYRSVQVIEGKPGAVVQLEGKEVINFASNDYLGLAGDDRLIQASIAATTEFGTGSTGSRLLSGHRELHRELENAIASLKQTEDALVFSSGYLANLGAISAIVDKRDLILADTYNHSCLKNGAILSGATVIDYPHKNTEVLQNLLSQQRAKFRRCLIVTDSVFSMDGDLCLLPQLADLAREFNCMLLVDEAHATGVFGATGAGGAEHFGISNSKLIQVGTLSKALGSLGGFVAGSKLLIDFLRNRAASWIYTTALSPADSAAAISAIAIIRSEPERRQQLWDNVAYFKQQLPLSIIDSQSQIICCQYPSATVALQAASGLKKAGIFAPAIRPPTVPTSRIRFSLMATHQKNHIDRAIAALTETLR